MNQSKPVGEAWVVTNRRAFPRTVFSGPVLVDTRKKWQTARAVDVSAGGMRIQSPLFLPIGLEVEVYFELHHLSIETRATVVRQQGQQFALRFSRRSSGRRRTSCL